jgi:hypothetical protein
MTTYVVRRFKPKLLVFITTGTFNLLSKILATLRLSGAVWIEVWNYFQMSSNLCADCLSSITFNAASDRGERLCQNTLDLPFLSTLMF